MAAFSAVLVLGVIGFVLYQGVTESGTMPEIEVVADTVIENGFAGYLVVVRAHNRGQSTAAGVMVEGVLRNGPTQLERAEVTLDFVPSQAFRRAGLIFSHDPRLHSLQVRVRGFQLP